ncbi:MAG: cation-transporting P-type ATPase [Promethearchaeota archaeon]|nr:MAG: cation-transporting P-type ATPase [Candidatus Lokiarchaeota archaeon]
MDNQYYNLDKSEIYEKLDTDPHNGLSEQEATARLEKYGPNELPKVSRGLIKIYLAPLFNWLIVIYLLGALILFLIGLLGNEKQDIVFIAITLGVVLLNCLVAIIQQYRATKKLEALKELSAPTTVVIREGNKHKIPTRNVVLGDLLDLTQGDKVPADARVIDGKNLEVNEASLTGESEPIQKDSEGNPLTGEKPIQDRDNMLFYGTYITRGNSKAIVVKIGGDTEIGQISEGLNAAGTTEIPIRQKMNNFGKYLGLAVIIFWILTMLILFIWKSEFNIARSLNSALDILPINIPLLTTIVLITGVLNMAKTGVIIRNLASVDSLGRVSVVCTDKTGTLTRNQMCVQHIWSNGHIFEVTGEGYTPKGEIKYKNGGVSSQAIENINEYPYLKLLIISGFLNNNSALVKSEVETAGKETKIVDKWKIIGSPTEGALVVLFQKIMGNHLLDEYQLIDEFPFDSSIKRMTKIFQRGNTYFSFTKGASEIIIPRCSRICNNGNIVEFSNDLKRDIEEKINRFASEGFRILSICYKKYDSLPPDEENERDDFESDMIYLGFVTISDPPRAGVTDSVEECYNAGIEVVMITGDSTVTGRAIGERIGIIKGPNDKVIEGEEIKTIESDEDFNNIKVFARVSPKHKENIVKRYKKQNRVVSMTGDGVNDTLALNMADCGVAMGIQGTDVAKEASDMVISDDSFNSIVKGIHQGRGIFSKIRAVVFFYICINLFEGLVQFFLAIILGLPYFLSETYYFQWLFLSLTLHSLPGLILTFDSISDDVMKEKPRNSEEILSKKVVYLLIIFGILLTISMLIVYSISISGFYPVFEENLIGENMDAYPDFAAMGLNLREVKTLTMLMVVLFFCESFLVFQIRRPNKSLFKSIKEDSTKLMYLITFFLFNILLLLMYVPNVQIVLNLIGVEFNFMFLTAMDWLVCFLISLICIVGFEIVKYIARRNNIKF